MYILVNQTTTIPTTSFHNSQSEQWTSQFGLYPVWHSGRLLSVPHNVAMKESQCSADHLIWLVHTRYLTSRSILGTLRSKPCFSCKFSHIKRLRTSSTETWSFIVYNNSFFSMHRETRRGLTIRKRLYGTTSGTSRPRIRVGGTLFRKAWWTTSECCSFCLPFLARS